MAIRAPSAPAVQQARGQCPAPRRYQATRLRSDILLPGKISRKDFQYSLAAAEVHRSRATITSYHQPVREFRHSSHRGHHRDSATMSGAAPCTRTALPAAANSKFFW